MNRCCSPFVLAAALSCPALNAAASPEDPGPISWDAGLEEARTVLAGSCREVGERVVAPPSFPLAAASEVHLICRGMRTDRGPLEAAAFVFADGVLALAEARGGAVAAFGELGDDATTYLHFAVSGDWRRFVDEAADTVRFLGEEALHPNLFTWANPFLAGASTPPTYETSAAVPAILPFGDTLDALLPVFEDACPLLEVQRDLRVWLPHSPARQDQVNCFGHEYAGFPRKIEAVFGDGVLELAWILTGAGEEARVRRALVAAFGEPESVAAKWEVFHGGRVGLRKDKPEVLLLSERMAPLYAAEMAE